MQNALLFCYLYSDLTKNLIDKSFPMTTIMPDYNAVLMLALRILLQKGETSLDRMGKVESSDVSGSYDEQENSIG